MPINREHACHHVWYQLWFFGCTDGLWTIDHYPQLADAICKALESDGSSVLPAPGADADDWASWLVDKWTDDRNAARTSADKLSRSAHYLALRLYQALRADSPPQIQPDGSARISCDATALLAAVRECVRWTLYGAPLYLARHYIGLDD